MIRLWLVGLFLLGSVSLGQTAEYNSSSSLDLTSLKFSGIDFTLTPQLQFQGASVGDGNGIGVTDSVFKTFASPDPWNTTGTNSASLAGVGSSTATSDASHFLVTALSTGGGFVGSNIERDGFLHANTAGTLTITINYQFAHSAIPASLASGLAGFGGPQLVLQEQVAHGIASNGPFGVLPVTEQGTLSVTRVMAAGETVNFGLSTGLTQTVPIPDMFWPAAALLLVGCLVARKRMA